VNDDKLHGDATPDGKGEGDTKETVS